MKNSRLQVTIREMLPKTFKCLLPLLLTSAVAGAVLAILAPLGTDKFSLFGRFSYWIGLCLAGGLGAAAAEYGLGRLGKTLTRWPLALFQSFGAAASVTLFIIPMHGAPNAASFLVTLFYIWVIAMTICAVGALQEGRAASEAIPSAQTQPPALRARLKPALRRADIYALEAQDHYVRVITSEGEDLILMRLSDAMAETAPLTGLSPHRSWWVAESGVDETIRRNGKAIIRLKNGLEVPVSRGRLKALKASAWV